MPTELKYISKFKEIVFCYSIKPNWRSIFNLGELDSSEKFHEMDLFSLIRYNWMSFNNLLKPAILDCRTWLNRLFQSNRPYSIRFQQFDEIQFFASQRIGVSMNFWKWNFYESDGNILLQWFGRNRLFFVDCIELYSIIPF